MREWGIRAAALALMAAAVSAPASAAQGVSDSEVVLGTIQDLSGPLVAYSKETLNGMNMRIDEANAAGGVAGRKIKLLVEDSGYDTKRAMLAAQKLSESDGIFAVVGSMGTTIALTTQQVFIDAGVINLFPLGSARGLYDPPVPLKFAFSVPYFQQGKVIVKALNGMKAQRKWCSLVQDDDLGSELMSGVDAAMKEIGGTVGERTTYKRGATDFSSQVARLKDAGCDTVVLGTTLRETVGTLNEAKKVEFAPAFVGTSAAYSNLLIKLAGPLAEGVMASHSAPQPYAEGATKPWFDAYKAKYGADPGQFAVMGYSAMDWTLATMTKVGKPLTADSFVATLESTPLPRNALGFDEMKFSKTSHIGSEAVRVDKVENGKWVSITDFIQP